MRKYYFKVYSRFSRIVVLIILIGTLIISGFLAIFGISDDGSRETKEIQFTDKTLNTSVSFSLGSDEYCDEVRFNFTSINETRNFIKNGEFNLSSNGWDALNEPDINYEWKNSSLVNSECISINLTGVNSKIEKKPLDNYTGIENCTDLTGWDYDNNNDSAYFIQGKSQSGKGPSHFFWLFGDPTGTGSLTHRYNATSGYGMANSSFVFSVNLSFPVLLINLSFWYCWRNLGAGAGNEVELGVYLITPSNIHYKIKNWDKHIVTDSPGNSSFSKKSFYNISEYITETGEYNLTFYSIHDQSGGDFDSFIYFDDIELTIVHSLKELPQNTTLFWNQSIYFDRTAFLDGIFNYSCFITNKFNHINRSDIFLSIRINDYNVFRDSLKNLTDNIWINDSLSVKKIYLNSKRLNISIGLFFNTTTYIFPNETFTIFFDNISLQIGANPNPSQVELKVYVPDPLLNESFEVDRDLYTVNISKVDFSWSPNQVHWLNLTCNSSEVVISCTLTYFVIDKSDKDDNNGTDKPPLILNSTFLVMVLIILLSFSSFLFVDRFEKRFFMNPKYDYIKKLKFKRKMKIQKLDAIVDKKPCISCGRSINLTAKFCEHCGKTQI